MTDTIAVPREWLERLIGEVCHGWGESFQDSQTAEEIRSLLSQPPASHGDENYTCIGKGGFYSKVGEAKGAGTLRDQRFVVYESDSVLYVREYNDFQERMKRI